MKLAFSIVACGLALVACSKDPQRQDLEMFCSSDALSNGATLPAVGDYVLAHAHPGTQVALGFSLAFQGSLPPQALVNGLGDQLDAAHITDCPTYARLWGARPR